MWKHGDRANALVTLAFRPVPVVMEVTVQSVDTEMQKVLVATDNGIWQWLPNTLVTPVERVVS